MTKKSKKLVNKRENYKVPKLLQELEKYRITVGHKVDILEILGRK